MYTYMRDYETLKLEFGVYPAAAAWRNMVMCQHMQAWGLTGSNPSGGKNCIYISTDTIVCIYIRLQAA